MYRNDDDVNVGDNGGGGSLISCWDTFSYHLLHNVISSINIVQRLLGNAIYVSD